MKSAVFIPLGIFLLSLYLVPPTIGQDTTISTPPPFSTQSRWSTWFNRDSPDKGEGDFEKLTPSEINMFCTGGSIIGIECQTVDGIPHYSSGEITSCTVGNGSECFNANNFPIPCSDYKVRYHCNCSYKSTTGSPWITSVNGCGVSGHTGSGGNGCYGVTGSLPIVLAGIILSGLKVYCIWLS